MLCKMNWPSVECVCVRVCVWRIHSCGCLSVLPNTGCATCREKQELCYNYACDPLDYALATIYYALRSLARTTARGWWAGGRVGNEMAIWLWLTDNHFVIYLSNKINIRRVCTLSQRRPGQERPGQHRQLVEHLPCGRTQRVLE